MLSQFSFALRVISEIPIARDLFTKLLTLHLCSLSNNQDRQIRS